MTSDHTMAQRRRTSAKTGLLCSATLLCAAPLLYVSPVRAQLAAPPPAAPPAPAAPPVPAPSPAPPAAPGAPGAPATAPVEPAPAAPAPTDQGPDTLPPLETPSGTVQVVKPATVTVVAVGPARTAQPVRAERRLALLGELSWNGLAGFGPILVFHAFPQLAVDLGAGLGFVGWKLGVRTRYNFLTSEVSPFVGAGFVMASGFDAPSQDLSADDDNRDLNIKLRPSAFFQGTVGLDYTDSDGFTFLGALGFSGLISRDNVEIVTGTPTPDEKRALDILFKSGIVISIAIGYSFR